MEVDQKTKDECEEEIKLIHETINKDQAEYDKQLLTLSSAFLAVSLSFIKDVVPLPSAIHTWLLYWAYASLVVCIASVLFSYQFSIAAHWKAKEHWERKKDGKESDFPYGHATIIPWINRSSGLVFAMGVFFLALFVILNLKNEANMKAPSSGNAEERGSCMKVPPKPAPTNQSSSANTANTNQTNNTNK